MPQRLFWLMLGAAVMPPAVSVAAPVVHRYFADQVLGAPATLIIVGADPAAAARANLAAQAEIRRLDGVLSGWRDDSELAALNRSSGPFAVSAPLFDVISACESWREAFPGAFSGRLGAVEAEWTAAAQRGSLDPAALQRAAEAADSAQVRLDPVSRTIDRQGVVFAIDALAKGYIIDAAFDAAWRAAPEADGMLLDIGGDMICRGAAPSAEGWRIGIAQATALPGSQMVVQGGAVASSGVGARDRRIGDAAFAHTLSPRDGGARQTRLATVTAPTAALADVLATIAAVMEPKAAIDRLNAYPGAEGQIVDADGAVWTTAGLELAETSPARLQPALFQAAKAWPKDFQLYITYQIPVVETRQYRAPFAAIFITDEKGALVRTVSHVGDKPPRFLDSNYIWYGLFRKKLGDAPLDSVTRPTQPPGRHSVIWDGKDDAGRPVPQGRYTINIEVSREHGGHSLQSLSVDLGDDPASALAPPKPECGEVTVLYGKVQNAGH